MLRRRKGRVIHAREPFAPGHICSAYDANVLNMAYARRVCDGAEDFIERNPSASQRDLDLWVEDFSEGLLDRRQIHQRTTRGLELEIAQEAERTYELEMLGRELQIQDERAKRLTQLRQSEEVVLRARITHEKRVAARRATLEELLEIERPTATPEPPMTYEQSVGANRGEILGG